MQRKEPDFLPAPCELQTAVQPFPPRQNCWAAAPQRANTQGAPELSRLRRRASRSDLHPDCDRLSSTDIDPEAWLADALQPISDHPASRPYEPSLELEWQACQVGGQNAELRVSYQPDGDWHG